MRRGSAATSLQVFLLAVVGSIRRIPAQVGSGRKSVLLRAQYTYHVRPLLAVLARLMIS